MEFIIKDKIKKKKTFWSFGLKFKKSHHKTEKKTSKGGGEVVLSDQSPRIVSIQGAI